jgi:hypothetical protein
MTVPRRQFGATPVSLSTICYGTMRLVPARFSADERLRLLLLALDTSCPRRASRQNHRDRREVGRTAF